MKNILYYFKLYVLIVSQYLKAKMQYRTDFVISFFGMIFRDLTGFFGLMIIFKSIPEIKGWNFYELVFLYSFALLTTTPLQLFFDNVWDLRGKVDDGTFIKYYFRPLNMMFYYMSEVFDIKGISQLVFSIVGIVYASVHLGLQWNFYKIVMFIVLFAGSSLIMISLMIIASSTCFWTMNSISLIMFFYRLREYARYPMSIFNSVFKFIFTCIIPIGFIAYYPLHFILRPGQNQVGVWMTPVVGILLFIIAYRVWVKGIRSYTGTGS